MAFCRPSIDQRPVGGVHHLSLVRQTRLLCLECRRGECVTGFPYTTTLKTNTLTASGYFLLRISLLFYFFLFCLQGKSLLTPYPQWVLIVGGLLATLSVLPIPVVFLLRRFQFLRLDTDLNKGVIRRNETTISTKQMMTDVDVSSVFLSKREIERVSTIFANHLT